MKVSDEAIAGFSNPEEVCVGLQTIDIDLRRERDWYGAMAHYADQKAIQTASETGELVRVNADDNFQIIGRFRHDNPELPYQPYLTHSALHMLHVMGRYWRHAARSRGIADGVRLAVTSMVRSQEYQDELVRAGKFAVPDSTHMTGNAFDIDLGGYYNALEDGREATVSLRSPATQSKIGKALVRDLGLEPYNPVRFGPESFEPEVTEAVMRVAEGLHQLGVINRVIEMPESANRVLHVAVSPSWTRRQFSYLSGELTTTGASYSSASLTF